jgi:hypothetical protein
MKLTIVGKGQDAKNLAYGLQCERFTLTADLAIRFGNIRTQSKVSGKKFKYLKELNTVEAINNARDKLKTLEILKENNILVPEFTTDLDPVFEGIWFARAKYHTQGNDILICEGNTWYNHDYWIRYTPINKEYRVHVFRNKVIQACIKYKEAGNDGAGEENDMIRNLEHGWKFSELDACNHNLRDLAIASVKALGLDFGAVDIIKGIDGKYYVLEVNTAPGLDNKRLAAYTECFKKYVIELETPNVKIVARIKYPQWFINWASAHFEDVPKALYAAKEYIEYLKST